MYIYKHTHVRVYIHIYVYVRTTSVLEFRSVSKWKFPVVIRCFTDCELRPWFGAFWVRGHLHVFVCVCVWVVNHWMAHLWRTLSSWEMRCLHLYGKCSVHYTPKIDVQWHAFIFMRTCTFIRKKRRYALLCKYRRYALMCKYRKSRVCAGMNVTCVAVCCNVL